MTSKHYKRCYAEKLLINFMKLLKWLVKENINANFLATDRKLSITNALLNSTRLLQEGNTFHDG